MKEEPQLQPRDGKVFERDVVSPADRIMAELPGTYYRLTEVAELLRLSPKTLRRAIHKGVHTAPSHQVTIGGMQMYLYTPEDIDELKEYYKKEPRANP